MGRGDMGLRSTIARRRYGVGMLCLDLDLHQLEEGKGELSRSRF